MSHKLTDINIMCLIKSVITYNTADECVRLTNRCRD